MSDEAQARTILVPLDLTPAARSRSRSPKSTPAPWAPTCLLHVLRPGAVDPANVLPTEAVARTYLDTVEARLRGAGIHAEASCAPARPPRPSSRKRSSATSA